MDAGVSNKIKDKIVFLARYVHELRCLKQRQRQDFLSLTLCAWTQVSRTKGRRLLLLNDRVVCVTVTGRPSEGTSRRIFQYFQKNIWDVNNLFVDLIQNWRCKGEPMTGAPPQERLSLKWSAHVSEVEVDKISFIFIF